MKLSVIIPTYNRNDLLINCLDKLLSFISKCDFALEIVVSDDSKESRAKNLIEQKYLQVKYLAGPQKGPAANRNNGATHADGDWLVFLDDDCLPDENWLQSYAKAIALYKDKFVFEGKTNTDRPKQRFDEEAPLNLTGDNLWSCNFAIKRELFFDINGFDESFPFASMEDVDFCKRVKNLSEIKFVPEALVIHPWRRVIPFSTFQKHLKSHKHFAKKYNLQKQRQFRIIRLKIFIGSIFIDFKELGKYGFRGWPIYIEKCLLNFCLIFI